MTTKEEREKEKKAKERAVWSEKKDVSRQWGHMLEIMKTYCKLPKSATKFVLDLQLYKKDKDTNKQAHPRIWLTSDDSRMGIHLMLYSIDFEDEHISNENVIDIFSEYMRYYAQNSEKFKYDNYDGSFQYSIEIKFEISNRG